MTIPLVRTVKCMGEVGTDGHAPMKFLCDDGALYYCKYRKRFHLLEERDYLRYELVGTALLNALDIATPEVAFVQLQEGSFDPGQIPQNAEHAKAGIVAFGSRHRMGSLVNVLHRFRTDEERSLLHRPEDLVRIAIFDSWAGNADRGRPLEGDQFNFNLLLCPAERGRLRFTAFDHAFLFHGDGGRGRIGEPGYHHPHVWNMLFSTPLMRDVVAYLGPEQVEEILADLVVRLRSLKGKGIVERVMEQTAMYWGPSEELTEQMLHFLWDESRLVELPISVRSAMGLKS